MLGMVASLIGDFVLSFILAHLVFWANATGFMNGCVLGVLVWIGFIAAPNLPQGIYERRPFKLFRHQQRVLAALPVSCGWSARCLALICVGSAA